MNLNVTKASQAVIHNFKEYFFSSKRRASRIYRPNINLQIHINHERNVTMKAQVVDMSATGIRLECPLEAPLEIGERLKLRFLDTEPIKNVELEVLIHNYSMKGNLNPAQNLYHLGCEFLFPDKKIETLFSRWSSLQLARYLDRRRSFFKDLISFLSTRKMTRWTFQPVRSLNEIQTAFHLVYREYLKRGYIRENPFKTFFHFHSLLPHAWTFAAVNKGGQVGGTITLIPDHATYGLPAEKVFADEISKLRGQGRNIGEVGMLAIDPFLFPSRSFSLGNISKMRFLFRLYRIMFIHALEVLGLDDLIIMVNPRHVPIYQYLYFFQQADTRSYDAVNHAPAVFMRADIHEAKTLVGLENKVLYDFFFPERAASKEIGRKYILSLEELKNFLDLDRTTSRLNTEQKDALMALYRQLEQTPFPPAR